MLFQNILGKNCNLLLHQLHLVSNISTKQLLWKRILGNKQTASKVFICSKSDAFPSVKEFSMHDPLLAKYAEYLVGEYDKASDILTQGNISDKDRRYANKQVHQLRPSASLYQQFKEKQVELKDLRAIVDEAADTSLVQMAKSEIEECHDHLKQLNSEILFYLVPPERGDNNDIILEVSAGVGGQEAMLFTEEIFKMYMNFAAYRNWQFEVISKDMHDIGAVRKASAIIRGEEVYKWLKYEGGVHRVQRVPRTERGGRVHTSTMTVAIMPQPSDIDIQINPKDLKVDTFRAAGAGGQHVNTTDSAVRITHLPTGTVAECQAGRSQLKNREIALEVLRSRLYEKELDAQTSQYRNQRKIQVGTAGRSEKIRTYNFNQDRITDHRVGYTTHNMEEFLSGGEALDDVMEILQEESRKERLAEIVQTWIDQQEKR